VTTEGVAEYRCLVIFPNSPQHRTLVARVREWHSSRRAKRQSTTLGVEHHQRMVQALRTASRSKHDDSLGLGR
jgi:hypothetical protein